MMVKINYFNNRNITKILFSLIVTVIIFYFLFTQISLGELLDSFNNVNPIYLFWFFVTLIVVLLAKAFRYKQFFDIKFRRLAIISAIHNFALNTLPSRSGELIFLYLLKKNKEKYTKSIAGLIIFRLMDVLAVILILLFSLLFLDSVPPQFDGLFRILVLFCFLISTLIISMVILSNMYVSIINFFTSYFRLFRFRILLKLSTYLKETLNFIGKTDKYKLISLFSSSLLIWVLTNISVYFIFRSMIPISLLLSFIINSFMILILLIPIQGFMGFGTSEAPLYLILLVFGVAKEIAISLSFVAHFVVLFSAIFLGVVAMLIYNRS